LVGRKYDTYFGYKILYFGYVISNIGYKNHPKVLVSPLLVNLGLYWFWG